MEAEQEFRQEVIYQLSRIADSLEVKHKPKSDVKRCSVCNHFILYSDEELKSGVCRYHLRIGKGKDKKEEKAKEDNKQEEKVCLYCKQKFIMRYYLDDSGQRQPDRFRALDFCSYKCFNKDREQQKVNEETNLKQEED